MPISFEEATKRYEGYVKNIQDSIYTIESYMGADQVFTFKAPQVISNLDKVDLKKEENMVSLQIEMLEKYKKMISYEKKRRSMGNVVQEKKRFADFKAQLKTKRRSDRVTNPYRSYQGNQGQADVPLL